MPISRPRTEYVSCPVRRCVSADSPDELEREDTHPHEVLPVDPLERLREHERTPRSAGPFAAQSRDDPLPYSLPASTPSVRFAR